MHYQRSLKIIDDHVQDYSIIYAPNVKHSKANELVKQAAEYFLKQGYVEYPGQDIYNDYKNNKVIYYRDNIKDIIAGVVTYDFIETETLDFEEQYLYEEDDIIFMPCAFVQKEYRGEGIFKKLFNELIKIAIKYKLNIYWGVDKSNDKAIKVYNNMGAETIGMDSKNIYIVMKYYYKDGLL